MAPTCRSRTTTEDRSPYGTARPQLLSSRLVTALSFLVVAVAFSLSLRRVLLAPPSDLQTLVVSIVLPGFYSSLDLAFWRVRFRPRPPPGDLWAYADRVERGTRTAPEIFSAALTHCAPTQWPWTKSTMPVISVAVAVLDHDGMDARVEELITYNEIRETRARLSP